jgi:hypothetical protein
MLTAPQSRQVRRQGFFGRLLRRPDKTGFAAALENTLATSLQLDAVDEAAIHSLMAAHRVKSLRQVNHITRDLVESVAQTMQPEDFGGEPERQLRFFATRLEVPEQTIILAVKSAAKRLFREACEGAIDEFSITPQETEELIALRQRIGLNKDEATLIFQAVTQRWARLTNSPSSAGARSRISRARSRPWRVTA